MIAYIIKRCDGKYYKGVNIFNEHVFVEELPIALILPTPGILVKIIKANDFTDCKVKQVEIKEL